MNAEIIQFLTELRQNNNREWFQANKSRYYSLRKGFIEEVQELIDRIAKDDMVRGVTIAAGGFFGPQGRELRIPLADPKQNDKIEAFEYKGYKITNFEMESSSLAGLSALMGHRAMTVCCIIAGRVAQDMNTEYKGSMTGLIETVLDRI